MYLCTVDDPALTDPPCRSIRYLRLIRFPIHTNHNLISDLQRNKLYKYTLCTIASLWIPIWLFLLPKEVIHFVATHCDSTKRICARFKILWYLKSPGGQVKTQTHTDGMSKRTANHCTFFHELLSKVLWKSFNAYMCGKYYRHILNCEKCRPVINIF